MCNVERKGGLMKATSDNLRSFIKKTVGSYAELERITGISQATIRSMVTRGFANSSLANALPICEALNIDPCALADGDIVTLGENVEYKIVDLNETERDEVEKFANYLKSQRGE